VAAPHLDKYYPIRMTITFENENDVIVYALEKIICYARKNQYIFVAQSVWWIASIIGLTDGLVTHINNLRVRSETNRAPLEIEQLSSEIELASALQDHLNIDIEGSRVHPERIPQFDNTVSDNHEVESSEPELDRATSILQSAKRFIGKSQKERRALEQRPCVLSRMRSGKIPVKPLTKKQRNRLQAIPKDTLATYLDSRK